MPDEKKYIKVFESTVNFDIKEKMLLLSKFNKMMDYIIDKIENNYKLSIPPAYIYMITHYITNKCGIQYMHV